MPRDRDGTLRAARSSRKRQRRLSGVDELVISLSAKGLTTGEVAAHLAEVYGAEVSRQTISTITDKVVEGMAEWQNRPLDPVYPVVFIDAINVKIRDGKVANRPIYVALGGHLRRAAATSSGCGPASRRRRRRARSTGCTCSPRSRTAAWTTCCMVVCDGLTGLPDAIAAVWPQTIIQTCVVHLLRNSFRYAGRQHCDAIAKALRPVYTAADRGRGDGAVPGVLPRPGASATRRSCGCGRTPGRSSCRSWPSTPRSARSSARPTRSRASTPGSAGRSRPAGTSPTSRPRSSASTWRS